MIYLIFYVSGLCDSGTHIYEFLGRYQIHMVLLPTSNMLSEQDYSDIQSFSTCEYLCINNCGVLPITRGAEASSLQEYEY